MAQFNLSSATISTNFIDDILYPFTGYVPFVYDDSYPSQMTNADVRADSELATHLTDPSGNIFTAWYYEDDVYNTSSYSTGNIFFKRKENYKHSNFGTYGKIPYNPSTHSFVNGSLRIGLGTRPELINKVVASANTISNAHRHGEGLYDAVYTDGLEIGGTVYKFPTDFTATVGSGGKWFPKSGSGNGSLISNSNTNFQYTGSDSDNNSQRFSYVHAKNLANAVLTGTNGIVSQVRTIMNGSEDAFPYDNALAQEHFDIMCLIAYVKGAEVLKQSHFIHQYKQVDGSAVTQTSHLSAYDSAAYQLPWFAVAPVVGAINYRFSWSLVDKIQPLINLMLTSSLNSTSHNLSAIVTAFDGTSNTYTGITKNPDWYRGPAISADFQFAPKDYKAGDYQTINKVPPGTSPSFKLLSTLSGGQSSIPWKPTTIDINEDGVIDIADVVGISIPSLPTVDFWANSRINLDTFLDEIYNSVDEPQDIEQGDENYYKLHPIYQSYYAAYWQDGNSYFHGAQAHAAKPAASKHGAAIASTAENQLPSFMFGVNEDGAGTSKVFIRSSLSGTSTVGGVTSAFDIADGKSLGTITYGQWTHFAVTRKGTTFRTFKNGVQQDTWEHSEPIKFPTQGTSKFVEDGLDLSIGRSQGSDYFYGYLDGIKYTKGESLYNANFTPSTSAPAIENTTSNYYGRHHLETVTSALQKLAVQLDVEYKLRIGKSSDNTARPIANGTNEGKLLIDVGPRENLFDGHSSDPTSIIVRDGSGDDPSITGLNPSAIKSSFDASEYASLVEFVYQDGKSEYDAIDVFDSNNPYRGINGELLERATYVTEPAHPTMTRTERATSYLNELKRIKRSINLDLDYYDIQGDFEVGDNIFVYDPDLGFEDTDAKVTEDTTRTSKYQVSYQGQYINPEKIRVTSITWPIKNNYGVYLRRLTSAKNNTYQYINLTPYIQFETAGTSLEVGDLPLKLGDDLRFSSAVSGVVTGTKGYTPNTVSNLALTSGFIEDATGESQAIIKATWTEPMNTDGTLIQNGEFYRIRWRKQNTTDPYSHTTMAWGTNEITIEGLGVATNFEVGVAPVNSNGDTNDYVTANITTAIDTVAPSKPGPADTITPGALRTQIVHSLGRAVDDAGNAISSIVDFTLQNDVAHFNIYYSTTSGFSISGMEPKETFAISASQIRGEIPFVCEIALPNGSTHYFRFTVTDKAGNESAPSDQQSAQGQLIATANISDAAITELKVANAAITNAKIDTVAAGKITAGTIAGQIITVGTNTSDSAIIKSNNYSSGSAGWAIKSDGTIEANTGNFRGDITGASGTFSGALSAATGTFSGTLSSVDGTFTGSVSANQISGGTLNFDSVTANNLDFSELSSTSTQIINKIATGAIARAKLENNIINADKIENSAVTNDKIQSVAFSKVTAVSISASDITSGTMSANRISGGSIDAGILTGDAAIANLSTSNAISIGGSGQTSQFVGAVQGTGGLITGGDIGYSGGSTEITFTSSYVDLKPGGTSKFRATGSQNTSYDDIRPGSNDAYDLGGSWVEWRDIYAGNSTIQSSDITLKENVEDITLGTDFLKTLTPIEFTWKDGGVRTHLGFSAQDIKQKLIDDKGASQNYAVYTQASYHEDYDEEEHTEKYGLRTNELIPILVKSVQELSTQISDLTARIETLEE